MSGRPLVEHVMESIIGLDVHPLAVLMAKANLLLALAPELKSNRSYDVQLRVYMADTLQTGEKKNKQYLAVPDGMGHDFAIPLKSVEMNRDLDQIIGDMSSFAERAASSPKLLEQARKGFLGKLKGLTIEETNLWNLNFSLMADLIKERRDTVWAFILKNAFRPAYLRRTKIDVIVGNPPWLSFRDIAEESYKARIKDLTFKYELLEKSEKKLFTQMDTSTLFFIHSQKEFLKPGGRMAFVMPKTVVLPSKQHRGFQRYGVTRICDLSKVTVTGLKNQHFFNVKSCVVVAADNLRTNGIPTRSYRGVLPRKNLPLNLTSHLIKFEHSEHDFLQAHGKKSPYYTRAFQGATLNPHTLWFVEPDPSVALNISRPVLKTSELAYKLCKEKKWKVRLKGPVEQEYLFATVLSDDILPFLLRRLTLTVLPVFIKENGYVMMTSEEIIGEGATDASMWVEKAEKIFAKRSKSRDLTAQDYLNYQSKLTDQLANPEHVVLYNKSGTNISAAYLTRKQALTIGHLTVMGFVAESVTYRIYAKSESEALYLVAVLNSSVVNKAIKPYQTEGVYHGKRDIHRRPFEVCNIPEFDGANATHVDLVEYARQAMFIVGKWGPSMQGGLAKVRKKCRDLVSKQLGKIDDLVNSILDGSEKPQKHEAGLAQPAMFPE